MYKSYIRVYICSGCYERLLSKPAQDVQWTFDGQEDIFHQELPILQVLILQDRAAVVLI